MLEKFANDEREGVLGLLPGVTGSPPPAPPPPPLLSKRDFVGVDGAWRELGVLALRS